jgi:chromosome segregation ATPase
MAKEASLNNLSQYIADNVEKIGEARQEVEEIQIGFNSAYVEWKALHDATLERLVEAIAPRLDEIGPDLRGRAEERIVEERRIIGERRQELRDTLIPETQAEADQALQDGQKLVDKLRQENPRLDRREEEVKAQRAVLEEELAQLNEQIRKLSGCLGVVFNFFKISKLDRQRQQVIGQLKVVHRDLRQVREEWQEIQGETQTEQELVQAHWQELTLKLARLQGELEYLNDETNREELALKRATRHVLDNLKEPVACSASDLEDDLQDMIEANIETDGYQEGLGAVGSLLALLDGIVDGLGRFDTSVESLIEQQRMHSAHLPKLDVTISDEVLAFHQQWDGLATLVRDDGRLCARPVEFLELIRPVVAQDLSDAKVNGMFESLGLALKRATDRWG